MHHAHLSQLRCEAPPEPRSLSDPCPAQRESTAEGEVDAIFVEAHELMDGDGDGDGPWDKGPCVVEAAIVEPVRFTLWQLYSDERASV